MIEISTLAPGVTLRVFRDSRFKQGCLSFQLVRPMGREEAGFNALLPSVLLRGTRQHPDLRSITQHLDDLYGAAVGPLVRRVGDYQTVGLYCGFMDDRFALPGEQVLGGMVEFLRELLLDSPLEDGGFLPGFVESEKINLISTIESERNDKRAYAMTQLLKSVCGEDSFGLPRLGEKADVAAISAEALYRHYQRILKESPVEIFYVGSAPAERIGQLLQPIIRALPREVLPLAPQTPLRPGEKRELTETMEVTQGKLCLAFTTSVTNRDQDFPAMQLLNTILGGGMTSKLFRSVREAHSLCYSISSGYYAAKGMITVSAGIDFDKEAQARAEIFAQLEACRKGDISQAELNAARSALISSLRATHDSPGAIEGYYATAALSGLGLTPQAYMEKLEQVTAAQVVEAAGKVEYHSGFFLKGGQA